MQHAELTLAESPYIRITHDVRESQDPQSSTARCRSIGCWAQALGITPKGPSHSIVPPNSPAEPSDWHIAAGNLSRRDTAATGSHVVGGFVDAKAWLAKWQSPTPGEG